jgi:hypothetical protein
VGRDCDCEQCIRACATETVDVGGTSFAYRRRGAETGVPVARPAQRAGRQPADRLDGQMLDYAANGVVYWPAERLRSDLESRCTKDGKEPEDVLRDSLGDELDPERFWDDVEQNLRSGRVRLIFVSDRIPSELRRVIEFLNERMSPTEVLGIEIKQYVAMGI